MKAKIAGVKNITRLGDALDAVMTRSTGVEGMVLVYGASGVGKSTALAYYLNQFDAIYVEASPAWSLGSMYAAILAGIGIAAKGRAADMERQIISELSASNRPLFVDELDYILLPGQGTTLRMLEALRSIYSKSQMPVLICGMSGIERKFKLREQLWRRMFQRIEFVDLDLDDARIVADTLCEVGIADDLLADVFAATAGRMGRLVPVLAQIERRAKGNGWKTVDRQQWGGKSWHFGR
ncbi:MAG: ATP-binding protein [Candidatus Contendobacter sp.]|nr:ATP-binding protein [Candidatus Contendobacter sp.]